MANELITKNWGQGNLTQGELKHLYQVKKKNDWTNDEYRKALLNGNIPYFDKKDKIEESHINAVGVSNGCPVIDKLSQVMESDELMNLYVANNRAFRMIKRLLKENDNTKVLELWTGNTDRTAEEIRKDDRLKGTPQNINKLNQHVGMAKYEDFALCQFFEILTDAEAKIATPVELPQGKKLYLYVDDYKDCATEATDLNDLSARMVIKTLPNMFNQGVKIEQAVDLLLNCFLPEPLLVGDNVWTRAQTTANYIGNKLLENQDQNLKTVGQSLLEKVPLEIQRIKSL